MLQPYPHLQPDKISIRQTRDLPPPSFRFLVTGDTLDLGYILPTTGRAQVFHLLERAPGGRTTKKGLHIIVKALQNCQSTANIQSSSFYLTSKKLTINRL